MIGKSPAFVLFFLLLFMVPVLAQLDLKEKAQLVGIQVDEKAGINPTEKQTDVSFIFTGKPSAYYHNYKDSILIIEFYDSELGEEKLSEITQAPFLSSMFQMDKIDVNKDIEGLEAQFKDIVRVTLPVDKALAFDFTLSDDFNVITLSTVWSKTGQIKGRKTAAKSKKWVWIAGGIVGVSAGAAVYFFLQDEDKIDPNIEEEWQPTPPSLPNL